MWLGGEVPGNRRRGIAGGLIAFWEISTHGKDGQTRRHVIKMGMNADGDRATWLERLDDKLLEMQSPAAPAVQWKTLADSKKIRLQELLHRELMYSGIINDELSYAATPLAVVGVEN